MFRYLLVALLLLGAGVAYFARSAPPPQTDAYELVQVVSTDTRYTSLTHAGDERLFVTEQRGRILIIQDGQVLEPPFLDLRELVDDSGNEEGLLSMAFDPQDPGVFYVNYTSPAEDTRIARYRTDPTDPNRADPTSAEIVLTVKQPYSNHNGGQLQFGQDGYLYIGMGDGGSGGDPQGHGQNLGTLLGALLRIDVRGGAGYSAPADNPFIDTPNALPEIWAYGLRNPWRFSFDRQTGDLYIADVGQNAYEEINFQPADSPGGENYGWNLYEGLHPYRNGAASDGLTMPIHDYERGDGCSVTGGYVYRGAALPELNGQYFYGDYCSGNIWSLAQQPDGSWAHTLFMRTPFNIASFGEDVNGELYVLTFQQAGVWQLVQR